MNKFFSSLKERIKQSGLVRKVAAVSTALSAAGAGVVTSFAADPAPADSSSVVSGVKTVFDTVSGTFSFANIISMIGIAIAAAALLVLGWFGLRKVISMIKSALRGKLRV